ncbi:MAG: DUF2170 family protein [Alphaproteobacteria bacterium]|nr:MAG: DUF2170 family protein [Alphaproteobacteria bacterium]
MTDSKKLAIDLALRGKSAEGGFAFDVTPIPGEIEVLRIEVEDREELPIFVSVSEDQILCIAYLFQEHEIIQGKIAQMNEAMLMTNITMPLSAFAKIDGQYVIYGALSVHSSLYDIVHELEILSSNSVEALEAMSDYLQ